MSAPVEGKVFAGTIGAGVGLAASQLILWLLGVMVWGAASTAEEASNAIAAVPQPVNGAVMALLTLGTAFVSGYFTKHAARPAPVVDDLVEPDELEFVD